MHASAKDRLAILGVSDGTSNGAGEIKSGKAHRPSVVASSRRDYQQRLANREDSQAKCLLLNAGLLDHGGDMKPCNIGMAVVI
jgi:hypothetical protein